MKRGKDILHKLKPPGSRWTTPSVDRNLGHLGPIVLFKRIIVVYQNVIENKKKLTVKDAVKIRARSRKA